MCVLHPKGSLRIDTVVEDRTPHVFNGQKSLLLPNTYLHTYTHTQSHPSEQHPCKHSSTENNCID